MSSIYADEAAAALVAATSVADEKTAVGNYYGGNFYISKSSASFLLRHLLLQQPTLARDAASNIEPNIERAIAPFAVAAATER